MDPVEQSKSPSDQKKYRLLTLSNALQVLLISTSEVSHVVAAVAHESESHHEEDESLSNANSSDFSGGDSEEDEEIEDDDDASGFSGEEDEPDGTPQRRAGACLTVGVGSFAEPEALPGLAHYLEHMLFMGSQKYPDENEFESFLSAHGGYSNGATDNEVTSYTFEVGPAHLELALDMFAHFFISPLLKRDAMERELSAIESEFSQAMQNDRIRTQELPEKAGTDVRKHILEFYETYCSANIMKLVVCGENKLDELEQWVTKSFIAIPNKHVAVPSFDSAGPPFGAKRAGVSSFLCKIVPVRDIHTLHLDWMIPPVLGQHHQKPADYLASLLGHESEGSVLSHVRRVCRLLYIVNSNVYTRHSWCDRHGRLRLWHVRCKVRHHYEADIGRHRALGRNRARCFRVSEYAKSKRLSGVGVRRAGSAGRHFFPLSGR
uniref:Peptidase M16 N-terminal domain-containing protein n=1 Tax=Hyaloperonospora arabidopsidis (strain Emoy2) TaxID=559515 RepID=M4C3C8_HYAAE